MTGRGVLRRRPLRPGAGEGGKLVHEAPTHDSPGPSSATDLERIPRLPVWAMILPAATLAVGIGIGAVVSGAGGGGAPAPTPTVAAAPTPTGSPSVVTVQVPIECLQLAQEAATALPPVDDAKQAVSNLDIQRIQDYIAKMQVAVPHLQELAQTCRDKSGEVQLGSPTPTG